MEYVAAPIRFVTSPRAQRTYLTTFFFLAASFVLLCVAALAFPVFYYSYVPKKVVSVPIHLQFNTGVNPFGVTSLSSNLVLEQAYDVSIELTLPRSPPNLERGNFMVALFAMKSQPDNPALTFTVPEDPYGHVTKDNVVFSSRRPAIIPYTDPMVSVVSRILFLLYHIFWTTSEEVKLEIPMGELVEFQDVLPLSLLLDVQAGQTFQVYSATVTLVARLTGLRWFMYNYPLLSFVVCTTVFWICEILSMALTWVALWYGLTWIQGRNGLSYGDLIPQNGLGMAPGTYRAGEESKGKELENSDSTLRGSSTAVATSAGGRGVFRGGPGPRRSGFSSRDGLGVERNDRLKSEDDLDDLARVKEENPDDEGPSAQPRYPNGDADNDDDEDGDEDDEEWKSGRGVGSSFDDGTGNLRRRSSRSALDR